MPCWRACTTSRPLTWKSWWPSSRSWRRRSAPWLSLIHISTLPPEEQTDPSKHFFGKATSLAVTGQLEAETFAMAFSKVYTFGPTFRAENSNTKTHAAEFWMIEPEIAFCDIHQLMDICLLYTSRCV